MRGNPDNLRKAAAAKSAAAQQRAEQALTRMLQDGQQITFRGLAQTARVSLDFLYRHHDIRQRVEQLRAQQQARPACPEPVVDPNHPSSVVRTLTAQLADLKRRHREETQQLRQALEIAHGENLELRRRLPGGPAPASPAHD
jgi:hypothetical protein